MDINLEWNFERTGSNWLLVAANQPNYRAEIIAVVTQERRPGCAWVIYENYILLLHGTAPDVANAKRWCALCIDIALSLPILG